MKTKQHKIIFGALTILFVFLVATLIFIVGKAVVNAIGNEEQIYCNKLRAQSLKYGEAFFYADWEAEMCGVDYKIASTGEHE
jgi:hypothetical protein